MPLGVRANKKNYLVFALKMVDLAFKLT